MQRCYNYWLISKAIVVTLKVYIGWLPPQILLLYLCVGECGVNTYKQGIQFLLNCPRNINAFPV